MLHITRISVSNLEGRFLNRNGRVKVLSLIFFTMGVILCVFPFIGRMFSKKEQVGETLGNLCIKKIQVELPIFSDVKEEMLEQGVGHIKGSSLPGRGDNTHCLLAGHRGLPRAQLLARLGEVKVGDIFSIWMENEEFYYRVSEIFVIRPEETEKLVVRKGRELVSIITCTPYGIHTHRLVVTGERIK